MSAVRIIGRLARDAVVRINPRNGTAWIEIELGHAAGGSVQARTCAPTIALQRSGEGASAQFIAHATARRLRAGARVAVHASGYVIRHLPSPHLELIGVELIEQLEVHPVHEKATA